MRTDDIRWSGLFEKSDRAKATFCPMIEKFLQGADFFCPGMEVEGLNKKTTSHESKIVYEGYTGPERLLELSFTVGNSTIRVVLRYPRGTQYDIVPPGYQRVFKAIRSFNFGFGAP